MIFVHISVDIIALALIDDQLHVLMGQRTDHIEPGKWAIPGGSLNPALDTSLQAAAERVMEQKTQWRPSYMEQLQTFGDTQRDERGFTLSVAYLTVCSDLTPAPVEGSNIGNLQWVPVKDLDSLDYAFDHRHIINQGLQRLRDKVEYSSLAAHFLPAEFTLSELQHIYEVILDQPLDKSTFRQNVRNANMVEPIEGEFRTGANRPAQLYRVKAPLVIYPKMFK